MRIREATQSITARSKVAIAGAVTGLALVALTSSPVLASGGASSVAGPESASGKAPTHEQMHAMMNSVHGEGASQKMHEAMGPQAEKMMDQCASMMDDTEGSKGMMGGAMMNDGMQDSSGMQGGGDGR